MNCQHIGRKIRVLIADDHPMMLMGIRLLLSTHKEIEVVAEVTNGKEVISKARELIPDIILMDISLPTISGLEATAMLHEEMPHVKVIILSMHDDKEYVDQFVNSGACGYVVKKSSPSELLQAIEAVYKGGAFFSPSISKILLTCKQDDLEDRFSTPVLTQRERQVLTLVARGYSSKQMADEMCISARTVGKYREQLMEKLNIHSVAELTQYAISKKMLELGSS